MKGTTILKKMGSRDYQAAYSTAIKGMVIIVRDASVKVPRRYKNCPMYTVDEVRKTEHLSEDAFRPLHIVKKIFRGEVVR